MYFEELRAILFMSENLVHVGERPTEYLLFLIRENKMTVLMSEFLKLSGLKIPPIRKLAGNGEGAIHGFSVPATEDAFTLWDKLCDLSQITGCWPVFLGGEEDIGLLNELLQYHSFQDVDTEIQKSLAFDLQRWSEKSALAVIRDTCSFNSHLKQTVTFSEIPTIGTNSDRVNVGFIPTQECYLSPAYLNFGGWYDCPAPHEHAGLLKRWNRIFGVEVLSITLEEICVIVRSPPQKKVSARMIHDETFLYCPDFPDDKIPRETDYFEEILNAKYWTFNWIFPSDTDFYKGTHDYDANNY